MNRSLTTLTLVAVLAASGCGSDGAATGPTETVPPAGASTTTPSTPTGPATAPSTSPATEPSSGPTSPNEGGSGSPVRAAGELETSRPQRFGGTVALEPNGCWMIAINGQQRLVAFPQGFDGSDPTAVVDPDGNTIVDGTELDVVGQIIGIDSIPGGADTRWGTLLAFCDPAGAELAVLDEAEPAFDPASLDDPRLTEMLRAADFTESWPCGYGFAVSTADQRVGVLLYAPSEPTTARTVELPDADWTAEVIVGKNLFVQHCDDVVEQWEAEPVVAARWPLTSGTFVLTPPAGDTGGCGGLSVSTDLTGAVARTPAGEVELPALSLVNAAWGCFAG
jgi:hypothetical protein